jgi:hypothetical protein
MVSIKGAPKKKKPRPARITKAGKLIVPQWTGWEDWDGEKFHTFKRHSHDWYYQSFKSTEMHPHLFQWMLMQEEYTKDNISSLKALPAWKIPHNLGINAKLIIDGMPAFSEKEAEYWASCKGTAGELQPVTNYMKEKLASLIEEGSKIAKEKKVEEKASSKVYVPTIQERITDQAKEACEAIDTWLDGFIEDKKGFDPKSFDFKTHFRKMGVTQAHARKLVKFYEGELEEFRELQMMPTSGQLTKMAEKDARAADMWEQLKEGYSHLTKKDVQNYILALESLIDACAFVVDTSKATRKPRTSKPKSADKLIEKLKYAKTNDKFQLASIRPEDVIGASELWVFNVKTRKLGKYVASNIDPKGMGRAGSGLSVKGTTIIGYDEKLSVQKTLRKPEEQVKEFKGAGKVALRTFLDVIKTTDTMLNGRCNLDTILLKASG